MNDQGLKMNDSHVNSVQRFDSLQILSSLALSSENESSILNMNHNESIITSYDVLLGKEKKVYNHPGNKRFREIISKKLRGYMEIQSKTQKSHYIDVVYAEIKDLGFRFHKRREESSISSNSDARNNNDQGILWHEINDKECRMKVSHALRDGVRELRRTQRRRTQRQKQKELSLSNTNKELQNFPLPKQNSLSSNYSLACSSSNSVSLLDTNSPLSYSREIGFDLGTRRQESEQSNNITTSSPKKQKYHHPYLESNSVMSNISPRKFPLNDNKRGDCNKYHQLKPTAEQKKKILSLLTTKDRQLPLQQYHYEEQSNSQSKEIEYASIVKNDEQRKMSSTQEINYYHPYIESMSVMKNDDNIHHENPSNDKKRSDILQHDPYHHLKPLAVPEKNISFLLTRKERQLPQQEYYYEEQSKSQTHADNLNNDEISLLNLERQGSIASFFSVSSADLDYDDSFLALSPSKTNNKLLEWIDKYTSPIPESSSKNNKLQLDSDDTKVKDREIDLFLESKETENNSSNNNNIHIFELIKDIMKNDNRHNDTFYILPNH